MDQIPGLTSPCENTLSGVPGHLFLSLINTLFAAQCSLNMKDLYPTDYGPKLNDNDEFDFVVVGAGASGSVLANKLSENGKYTVLVLEAGGIPSITSEIPGLLFSLQQTNEDWEYRTEPSENHCKGFDNNSCSWPRGKLLGGCTSTNAMLYVRGNKRDYDHWEELGNPGWGYESVMKAFHALEDVDESISNNKYGKNGFQKLSRYDSGEPVKYTILEAAKELGYPTLETEENLGYFDAMMTIDNGVRANAAKQFLGKVKSRKNLFVSLHSHVQKIIVENNIAKGVEVKINDKVIKIFSKKETILSAGSINTPQILMASGYGPRKVLEENGIEVIKDLPVGENLQDHIIVVGFIIKINEKGVKEKHPYELVDELYKYFMYRKGDLGTISITNLLGFINTKNDSIYPNVEFSHVLHGKNDQYLLKETVRCARYKPEIAQKAFDLNKEYNYVSFYPILINPKSRGKIALKSNKIVIYPNYLGENEDMDVLIESIKFIEKLIETEPFRKLEPEILNLEIPECTNFKFKSEDYYKCTIKHLASTIYHPVGTCKMGQKSDKSTVVDGRLKVHGVSNLRVVDASIMPKITSGNTMAPSMMIGYKGAEFILEELEKMHTEL